ncbi:SLBB domain-containing protein [Carboxylicivirga linearis]|uniref:SLBB domain-containing protein n=1 Tax=Carboxylicivirga linearis TaxID=1628157 RepID=A0ABS5K0S3_9BACT|nr:SLBB domain-containing protein [Carboxylicivirga linearis]MBS2100772.1 SLBB domain-containing protein [Carboxylicivirga linearis]
MKELTFFVFLILFLAGFKSAAWAQNVDPRNVDVNELTDDQIIKMIREIEKRGLTESQAIALAQARGMSQSQISILKKRMNELKYSSQIGDSEMDQFGSQDLEEYDPNALSEKVPVDSTQIDQRIFGFSFFNNENLSFEPNVNIAVSPSYVIGSGDEILIDVWGMSQENYQLEVNRNGQIVIPNVGPVNVGGLTQKESAKRVFDKLTLIYRDLISDNPKTFANITLGNIKAIKVNVIGEVFTPGTYTLPGTASAFNALYLSGGPNINGSFRDIQVIRDGQVMAHLDVYEFLIKGKTNVNIPLRDGDVVLVPTFINRVKVGGEFKRDGIFEGKDDETVEDLIAYAGGFNEQAYSKRIELYRITSKQRAFKDVSYIDYAQVLIQNGDSLYAGPILERYENKVTIEGAVYRPGNYELTEGLTLKELIEKADGVREDVFLNRGLITRLNEDLTMKNISFNVSEILRGEVNFDLKREDIVTLSSINDLREIRTVKIHGEIQLPGEFDYQDDMTLSDLVFRAGGFKESASDSYIEISRRLTYDEAKTSGEKIATVYQFHISRDLRMHGEDAKFVLNPFDQVFIRRSPGFEDESIVSVLGEVNYAGQFSLASKKERLSSIIERAGGLTTDAYPQGAMLTRKVKVSQQIKRLREEMAENDTTLVFDNYGFDVVSIDLGDILKNPGSKKDIYLEAGDELIIPREIQTVKITGGVLNPVSTSYGKGLGLRKYISAGGGFAPRAMKGKVYVIYPNGAAASTKNFLFFRNYPRVMPGTEVVVPQRPEREPMPATAWIAMASALASLSLTVVTIMDKL